jgi:ribose 1,5-bisphosphokinase PhnN
MAMITFTEKGSFSNVERWLNRLKSQDVFAILSKYATLGQNALSNATPVESGETAESWYYTIEQRKGYYSIRWHNHHVEHGVPIAVILQYGHGTGTGGYVQGRDYIMPAIRPIFDQIVAEAMKEVNRV